MIDLHISRPSESLDGYLQQHPDVESTLASPLVHPSGAIVHASDVYASVALLLDGKTSGGAHDLSKIVDLACVFFFTGKNEDLTWFHHEKICRFKKNQRWGDVDFSMKNCNLTKHIVDFHPRNLDFDQTWWLDMVRCGWDSDREWRSYHFQKGLLTIHKSMWSNMSRTW